MYGGMVIFYFFFFIFKFFFFFFNGKAFSRLLSQTEINSDNQNNSLQTNGNIQNEDLWRSLSLICPSAMREVCAFYWWKLCQYCIHMNVFSFVWMNEFVCDEFVCDEFVCDEFVCDEFVCDEFVCDEFVCDEFVCDEFVCDEFVCDEFVCI
jgi:hypothetical protein